MAASTPAQRNLPAAFTAAMGFARELMLRPLGNVVVLMPPLSIAPSEVDFLVEGVRASIEEATEARPT